MSNNLQLQMTAGEKQQSRYLHSAGSFLRHELLFILWVIMDVSIITPLALSLMPWARYWPPWQAAMWLLFLMLVAFNLGRLLNIFEVPSQRQRFFLLVTMVISIFFFWRVFLYRSPSALDFGWLGQIVNHFAESGNLFWSRDVAVFILVIVAWWRGLSLVGRRVDTAEAGLRLRAGTLVAAVLVGGLAAPQLPYSPASFILLFFFAALASIALSRVEQLELDQSGKAFPLGLRWLTFVLGAAAVVVLITGAITGFVSGTSIINVFNELTPLWTAIQFLTATVISTFSYVSLPLLLLFGWLVDFLVGLLSPVLQAGLENLDIAVPEPFATVVAEELPDVSESTSRTPQQLLTLLVMLVVIVLVTLALGRLVRTIRRPAEYESERLSPFEGIGRFKRPGVGRRLLQRVGFLRRWQVASSIRNIYREMSETAASAGYPRIESETPLEYLITLQQVWPENQPDIELITQAYTRVRYGEIPETEDELVVIQAAWKRLEAIDLDELLPLPPDSERYSMLDER